MRLPYFTNIFCKQLLFIWSIVEIEVLFNAGDNALYQHDEAHYHQGYANMLTLYVTLVTRS